MNRQRAASFVLLSGGLMFAVGTGAAWTQWLGWTPILQAAGIGLVALAAMLARKLRVPSDPDREAERHRWQVLKLVSVVLNFLTVMGLVAIVLAIELEAGAIDRVVSRETVAAFSHVLSLLLVAVGGYALWHSLHAPLTVHRSTATQVGHVILAVLVGVLAFLAAWLATGRGVPGTGLGMKDTPVLILIAVTLLALDLFLARSIPTLYILLAAERDVYGGATYFSRSKSVIAPTLGGLALLLAGFLAFLVAGNQRLQIFRGSTDPAFLVLSIGTGMAMLGASVAAWRLARRNDDMPLYQAQSLARDRTATTLLAVSMVLSTTIAVFAMLARLEKGPTWLAPTASVDLFVLALIVAIGPYGAYAAREYARVRRMEERFPDLLRDLASSHQGGLTLPHAVEVAAQGDYGDLSPEIRHMSRQLSWDVPFGDALTDLATRVSTPLVRRAVHVILEADRSGGNTSDVLLAAARDAREIKNLENERRVNMTLYTMILYITFGVFLVVTAILYGQFVPQIITSAEATAGTPGLDIDAASKEEYRTFYYLAAVVQAVGTGIVAGKMGTGRVVLGLPHSTAMVAIAAGVFLVLA